MAYDAKNIKLSIGGGEYEFEGYTEMGEIKNTVKVSKVAWGYYKEGILNSDQLSCISKQNRWTGKTTATVLSFLSKAMSNPCQRIRISVEGDSARKERELLDKVKELIIALGLDWAELSLTDRSIKYNPYVEIKKTVSWEEVDCATKD